MPSREHYEALWESVPAGLQPPDFRLRLDFLSEHVHEGDHVLDIGCGEGWFASELPRMGASVVAVDVAREPLRRARERDPRLEHDPPVELRLMDAEGPWPFADASVDVVWAGEVIEHLSDTAGWLSEARRVLTPGGRLLLSTPNHPRLLLLWLACSRRAFEAHFHPLADHLRFYTRASLTGLLGEFGFQQVSVSAAAGFPVARRLLLARAVRPRW